MLLSVVVHGDANSLARSGLLNQNLRGAAQASAF